MSARDQVRLNGDPAVRELSEEELSRLQAALFAIYRDVRDACARRGMDCLLFGGSSLGAERHGGFIPWDDDMDLAMPRADCERLEEALEEDFPGRYAVVAPRRRPSGPRAVPLRYPFLKVRRNGTEMLGVFDHPDERPGLSIDVFPLDAVPANRFRRAVRGWLVDACVFLGGCVRRFHRTSRGERLSARSVRGALLLGARKALGCLVSFFDEERWYALSHRIASASCRTGGWVTAAQGSKGYGGEILPRAMVFPAGETVFCGERCPTFRDARGYLAKRYGKDWAVPPPPEARERHFVERFRAAPEGEGNFGCNRPRGG